jgi:hypothetical protein
MAISLAPHYRYLSDSRKPSAMNHSLLLLPGPGIDIGGTRYDGSSLWATSTLSLLPSHLAPDLDQDLVQFVA